MLDLLNKTWRPILILLAALGFFLGGYFYYYEGGGYDAPEEAKIPFEEILRPSSNFTTFTEVPRIQRGMLLMDGAHRNAFTKGEISSLLSRVSDRGYDIEFVDRRAELDEKLRAADSFAVIVPRVPYSRAEADTIERFVGKGGKLLFVADPARRSEMNSLAQRFGIAFQPDYLYNMVEHDINFQNIFIRDFFSDELTRGLGQIVLYTAGSIKSSETGLAFTDENTRSSMVERIEPFFPIVKAGNGQVVAIHDLTFMIPPQNGILDNDRLVSNIADYLTDSRRQFEVADFPHFFKGDVDILLGRAALFDVGTDVKGMLSDFQIASEVRGFEDLSRDTVFFGLYEDSPGVAQYLEVAGIQVNGTLRTPFTPHIATGDTAIILLNRTQERHVLVVLGNSKGALRDMVGRLVSGRFRLGLVSELLGVYRSP